MRTLMTALAAAAAVGAGAPALAAAKASTRVVSCGQESCLVVEGRRDSAAAKIAINGHVVAVEGGRSWRARLPVRTVRVWSEPYARTISISVADGPAADARLPIGLLGQPEQLAFLVINLK